MTCQARALLGTIRGPFLLLTPICVLLGFSVAAQAEADILWVRAALVLLGALAGHVSVNVLNEYYDFRSGLDEQTQRTPFSGGSGSLPGCPAAAPLAAALGYASLALTVVVGLYLLRQAGAGLLPVGLAGVLLIVAYTPWVTRNPWLCLVAPGVGFGTLMVLGSHFVLTGRYGWPAFSASLLPFFLVNNLLLLNQFPDVQADRAAGRDHLPIHKGRATARWVYLGFLGCAYASLGGAVALGQLGPTALLGLATVPLALAAALRVLRRYDDIPALTPALGLNVAVTLLTPFLASIGILLG